MGDTNVPWGVWDCSDDRMLSFCDDMLTIMEMATPSERDDAWRSVIDGYRRKRAALAIKLGISGDAKQPKAKPAQLELLGSA
jgi:hypothetical protein